MKESKTKINKGKQLSKHHSNFNMTAKMLLAQQRSFSDNPKNSFQFSEKSRSVKIIPNLKCQDKKAGSYLDDFTPIAPVKENAKSFFGDSQKLPDKTVSRPVPRGRIGSFRNAKLETRYRTNSIDSAFSEESFADLDRDESTKLESLIDQLIFTDDRLNSDMSTYVKTEKLSSTDTSILDIGDLFNNTDIFTVDFESLAHETQASSFLERGARSDSENTESTSSISSSDSGKDSIYKYPTKISAFFECNLDKVLNGNNSVSERFTKFSSSLFMSSDEDEVIDCDGCVANKPIVSTDTYGTRRGDCSVVNKPTVSTDVYGTRRGDCSIVNKPTVSTDVYGTRRGDCSVVNKPTVSTDDYGTRRGDGSVANKSIVSTDAYGTRRCDGNVINKPTVSTDVYGTRRGDGSVVNKPTFSTDAYGTRRGDGCVNDCVHGCSFVDLSTLLDVTPYGSSFSVGENLPRDSQRHLNTDDDDVCVNESNSSKTDCSDTYANVNTTLRQVTSTQITVSASHAVTTKSTNSSNNKSHNSENDIPLTEVHFWPMKEEPKMVASLPSIKNCPVKCMDISDESINDCDEYSQESLYMCSLENLCGYGDQGMSGINQNNNDCTFLSDTYDEQKNRFTFKNSTRTSDSTDGQKFLSSSEDKSSEIKFSNQKEAKEGMDDSKGFNGIKLLNINDSVVRFDDKLDTVKLESYFLDSEFSKDVDAANISKAQSSSRDVWVLSNEDYVKDVVAKDHSYRAHIPANYKERNISVIDAKEKSNKTNHVTDSPVKQNPAKRPLVNDLNSVKQELSISEENSSKSVCSSSNAEFPGFKFLLDEESSSAIKSVLQRSTNKNSYIFNHSDDSGCSQRKVPKFSIIDSDETCVQSAILYQVLAMEQNSPSTSLSSSPFLPVKPKVKNHHYSKSPNDRNFKGHYLANLRHGAMSKQVMSMRVKDEASEMKELEKYLRGLIPTETYDGQDETFIDHQRKSGLFFRRGRSPCSFLEKLLTGEMTAQMYREIDQQFCENEQLIKNK